MAYYMDETVEQSALPLKFFSFSPCFRREAGSHGKDTRGLVRVHEFYKFEQVVLCEASHEESVRLHEELTKNAEDALQLLKVPYRVVVNCGGDLGLGQVKKYDIECWMPGEGKYRETHSSSYFHDFQTRRLNIRYRDADGTLKFAHSLNNTAPGDPALPRRARRELSAGGRHYQGARGTLSRMSERKSWDIAPKRAPAPQAPPPAPRRAAKAPARISARAAKAEVHTPRHTPAKREAAAPLKKRRKVAPPLAAHRAGHRAHTPMRSRAHRALAAGAAHYAGKGERA